MSGEWSPSPPTKRGRYWIAFVDGATGWSGTLANVYRDGEDLVTDFDSCMLPVAVVTERYGALWYSVPVEPPKPPAPGTEAERRATAVRRLREIARRERKHDAADLRAVAAHIEAGRYAKASKLAHSLDTFVRDAIPPLAWSLVDRGK